MKALKSSAVWLGGMALLVGSAVPGANATTLTLTETFDDATSTTNNGWTGYLNTVNGNNFGFSNTDNAGGLSAAGEMGGTVHRQDAQPGYYADTTIGGTLTLNDYISASGEVRVTDSASADGTYVLGMHFDPTTMITNGANSMGFLLAEANGDVGINTRATVFFCLSNGEYVFGDFWTTSNSSRAQFDYAYDPDVGNGQLVGHARDSSGTILDTWTLNLSAAQRATGASFTAFGMGNALAPSARDTEMTYYVDNVSYTGVPEPSTLFLLATGLLAYAWRKRK